MVRIVVIKLMERIIESSSNEGELVFDPFCGTATSCVASENLRIVATEIGNITNVIDVEEILDDIFSRFCIGK